MSTIDWVVLLCTLGGVLLYGVYRSRGQKNLESYFLSNKSLPWYIVLFSIMGTQASAITFLSAPGQAFTDGMRFVQYYFGLPLAMIVLCIFFLPVYHKLNVYTAYEYLQKRFDTRTRLLTSFLFLLSRGLSTGISIYAPSLILSSLMGWDIYLTNMVTGGLLIIYTVSGGVSAVSYTQTQQLLIIFTGMFLAGYMVMHLMPPEIGFRDALHLAGKAGKMNVITTGIRQDGSFDWQDKYNLFSGLIGGFFLALSYFGTDQSQVGRYLTAKDLRESKNGLLMNGFVKVPMQFLILLVGVLVFSFYMIYDSPVTFNDHLHRKTRQSAYAAELSNAENDYMNVKAKQKNAAVQWLHADKLGLQAEGKRWADSLKYYAHESQKHRMQVRTIIGKANPGADTNDTNYIFLHFVVHHLPRGLVGLLIAIIFLAAWGSIAAALNSLAGCTIIDWHHYLRKKDRSDKKQLYLSRLYTLLWGIFCVAIAQLAGHMGSLIEAVNILGSLFYGTILGIFCCALFIRRTRGKDVFYAAILTELLIVYLFIAGKVSFLWLNLIGCALVCLFALMLSLRDRKAV